MKKMLIPIIFCIALSACNNHGAKTEAGKTFVKFANAKTIKEKSKYVLEPEKVLKYMENYYKDQSDIQIHNYTIIQENDKGKYMSLKIKQGEYLYWARAKKEENGKYKIDWQDYTRYSPQTLGEFIANEEQNKKFKIYGSIDRSVSSIISSFIKEYYTFRIVHANIGQGVKDEKDEGYQVNEYVVGLCPKKKEECKEFYDVLTKRNINSACRATLELKNAPKDFSNPVIPFALVTYVQADWSCKS